MQNLALLPLELQCEIFRGPMTLGDYLKIRSTSIAVMEGINGCLESLQDEGDEGRLDPNMVLDMTRIRTISPGYVIIISSQDDLISLANHPTLTKAVFDIEQLNLDERNIFATIISFFSAYERYGNSCQDCQGRYDFIFLLSSEPISFIRIMEGTLQLHNFRSEISTQEFYSSLSALVPICNYIDELNNNVYGVRQLPCRNKINLYFDSNNPSTSDYKDLISEVSLVEFSEYYIAMPKVSIKPDVTDIENDLYNKKIFTFLAEFNKNIKLPKTKLFFPIPLTINSISLLERIFPNLTSIAFTLSSIEYGLKNITANQPFRRYQEVMQALDKYQEIIILDDLIDPRPRQEYINFFDMRLQNRIVFTDSE